LLTIFLSVSFDFSIYTFSLETLFFSTTKFFSNFAGYTFATVFATTSLPSIFVATGVLERVYFISITVGDGLTSTFAGVGFISTFVGEDLTISTFAGVGLTSALAGVGLISDFTGVGLTSVLAGVGFTSAFAGVGLTSAFAGVFFLSLLAKDGSGLASIGLNSVTIVG
jgi:hypothetical protein